MKEIAVISGKGGTGKTSVSASLAYLAKERAILADCDVDAADLHLLLKPDFANKEAFYSGKVASINPDKCIGCGKCVSVCRFEAVYSKDDFYQISEMHCEGCGYCAIVCPEKAVQMNDNLTGKTYVSSTRLDTTLVHAALSTGAENSGKLVSKVRQHAKELADDRMIPYVIIDGTPGIGCPVIASITGVSYVVLVTEPTVTGLHDLRRVYQLVKRMGIRCGCIINKADLNLGIAENIRLYLFENKIDPISELPYDDVFTKAILAAQTVTEFDCEGIVSSKLKQSWSLIQQYSK